MMIVARIIALLIGYGFGLFQTGYLYGKSKGIDIRQVIGDSGDNAFLRSAADPDRGQRIFQERLPGACGIPADDAKGDIHGFR